MNFNILLTKAMKSIKNERGAQSSAESAIYVSDSVVTQVLAPAVLSLGSQLLQGGGVGLNLPFTEYMYEWTKTCIQLFISNNRYPI